MVHNTNAPHKTYGLSVSDFVRTVLCYACPELVLANQAFSLFSFITNAAFSSRLVCELGFLRLCGRYMRVLCQPSIRQVDLGRPDPPSPVDLAPEAYIFSDMFVWSLSWQTIDFKS